MSSPHDEQRLPLRHRLRLNIWWKTQNGVLFFDKMTGLRGLEEIEGVADISRQFQASVKGENGFMHVKDTIRKTGGVEILNADLYFGSIDAADGEKLAQRVSDVFGRPYVTAQQYGVWKLRIGYPR